MAFFPGQFNQAGGTWVDPSRVQTSQSGGAYIGGMTPTLPTQDMSFMWGGNGGAAAPAAAPTGGATGALGSLMSGGGMFSNWNSAPRKELQPGDYGYTPPGMVSYSGEPPHLPYNVAPTSGTTYDPAGMGAPTGSTNIEGAGWTGYGVDGMGSAPTGPFVENPSAVGAAWGSSGGASPQTAPAAGGWNQSTLGGWAEPPAPQMDNNHPNGVYAGAYDPNFGKPSVNLQAYQQSPYLAQMGQGLRDQFTGFMNDGLSANRGAAVAAGGVGGSRAGIAEARTMTDAGKGFDSALANLYGQDYQAQMGRNLQQYGMDQNYALGNKTADNSYNLGLGSLDLQGRGQDINNYNTNRQLDQSGAVIGANLYNLGMQGPWNTLNNANGLASPYTGNGTTTTNTSSGGGAQGALGGALGTYQLGKNMNWWG